MAQIDVQKIDAQIRKLEELKRFMSDPTTAAMIEQLVSSNGSLNPNLVLKTLSGQGKSGHAWSFQIRPYGMAGT